MTAPKLTAASMLTDGERPDWLEIVAVFEITPEQRAAYASLLHVEDGVRVTVEAADAPAAASPRPAEEIARETITQRTWLGIDDVWFSHESTRLARAEFARIITQARADGAAAALAGQQPRDLAGRIRALSLWWFNAWASLGLWDYEGEGVVRECLHVLREADRAARGVVGVRQLPEIVAAARATAADSPGTLYAANLVKLADELEAIVRECEEKR